MNSPHKNKIIIGSHSLECPIETRNLRYTDECSGWYDGVHPYGSAGKIAYTESFVNILLYSLLSQDTGKDFQPGLDQEDDHTRCPQTKHMQKQKRKFSSVVTGKPPVKTQNRFSCISGSSENC